MNRETRASRRGNADQEIQECGVIRGHKTPQGLFSPITKMSMRLSTVSTQDSDSTQIKEPISALSKQEQELAQIEVDTDIGLVGSTDAVDRKGTR